jgi:hypothetical protein
MNLPPIPERIAQLPRDYRGYPVPWFATWNPDGTPNFVTADNGKRVRAIKERLCWVCGQKLGRYLAFVIGPMCSINRVSAEPPVHRECAEFSVHACPFLLNPNMNRMPQKYAEGHQEPPGIMIARNPGVQAIWMCWEYLLVRDGHGGVVLSIGDPVEVEWFAEGRAATNREVCESIASGLPILIKFAQEEGPKAMKALEKAYNHALKFLPPEPDNA